MAVYQFSALSDGQSLVFSASADRLNFDQTTIAAGDLTLTTEGSGVRVTVKSGPQAGKDVLLTGFTLEQIAATNFSFADGSFARVGDNSVGTVGDAGANGLSGGAGRDLLMGLGGNDNLQGGDGNDSVVGGTGNDAVSGNNGNDWLTGGTGNDTLNGGGGQDAFVLDEIGAANADLLADFSFGWDNVQLDAAVLTQIGAAGRFAVGDARFFAGTAAHDADDRIIYNSATQQILYDADGNGAGAAQVIATLGAGRSIGATDFWVFGESGGGGGGNVINGTAGDDTLIGTPGNDTINGLGGNDSIRGGEGADSMSGGDGNDTVDGYNHRTFDTDPDVDTLAGGLGNDVLMVDNSADVVVDAGGIDTVRAGNISWTLASGFENLILDNDENTLTGIGNELNNVIGELNHGWMMRLEGLAGNDTIFGGFQNDTLLGGDGNDSLEGGEDVDTMDGGAGNDTLGYAGGFGDDDMWGGTGADHFAVATPGHFANRIHDFASGVDKLRLDGDRMANVGAEGNFVVNDARFFAGTAAHDADDRVIWDGSVLWYDPDGTGSAAQQQVAWVTGSVVATDIFVVNGSGGGAVINGTAGNDSLVGGPEADTLNGFAGNDTLDGGGGGDSMVGGEGNDLYFVENINDVVVEAQNGGIDEVRSSISYTLSDFVNNLTLTGFASSGTGNDIDNVITASASGSFLDGLGGNDTLIGGAGGDFLRGREGNDSLVGGASADSLEAGSGNDTLLGGDGNDDISLGGSVGPFGSDVVDGGAGTDRIILSNGDGTSISDSVTIDLAAGTVTSAAGSATLTGIEDAVGGDGADLVLGNSGNNFLGGGFGNDTLDGGAGNDTLTGIQSDADTFLFTVAPGAANADVVGSFTSGSHTISLDATVMSALGASGRFAAGDARFFAAAGANAGHDADDRVVYNTSTGQLWYDADGSGAGAAQLIATLRFNPFTPPAALTATDIVVANGSPGGGGQVINGTAGDDTLTGTFEQDTINGLGGNDSINGLEGPDSLNGGDGNDTLNAWGFGSGDFAVETLNGGLGDDVYMVHDDGDIILPDPGGVDTVQVLNGSWTLAADLENLDLEDNRGIAADGTGNALNNTIRSASEGGTLFGLGGNDTLIGRNAQNTVRLEGGDGNDTLIGGWHTNFVGGAGDDLLIASVTQDNMTGGTGSDIFHFGAPDDDFITDFASGADKVRLDGTGFTQIGASGNFAVNDARFFAGTAAHDADDRVIYDASTGTLLYDSDGNGAGEAILISHLAAGTPLVATDITVVNGTAGGGTINGTAGNDSLVGGAGNDTINGNQGNDTLRGMGGDDSLDGGSGTDLLDGGLGNDFFVVQAGDTLVDAGGTDTVVALSSWALGSGFENLILATGALDGSGNSGSNVIEGNAANNTLRARDGNDTVTGGGGNDFFDFVTAPSAANADTITDFTSVDQLRFEDGAFTAIGATGTWGASDARFWASTAGVAHDASDRLVYNTTTGALYYDADGSGAGAAVLVATLQGSPTLSASDITVI